MFVATRRIVNEKFKHLYSLQLHLINMQSEIFQKKMRWILTGILIASSILHFIYIWQLRQTPYISHPLVDAETYHQKALNIIEYGWLGDRIFYQAPLYPYILAIIYKLFGTNMEMVIWLQATSSVFSVYLIYLMGKRLFNIEVGILSALLTLFYGVFVFYSGFLLKSSFSSVYLPFPYFYPLGGRIKDLH